jgi:nucleotide-binding universal stress UspA family protein
VDRWLNGSVADQVLRRAQLPVLLVTADCRHRWPAEQPLRILVPLDGSPLGEHVLPVAAELANLLKAELVLLRAVEAEDEAGLGAVRGYFEDLAGRLKGQGASAVTDCARLGEAADVIEGVAREERADLIAMATHGRSGLARVLAGSIATATLRRASVPLLLVRPRTSAP